MRRALAISPKQYMLRMRAERAAAMLVTSDAPIARIAAECGYYDQSQLTRQFRAHIGMTPNDYRHAPPMTQ
jgi:transcriptional regulator GlxA family with amidase domain